MQYTDKALDQMATEAMESRDGNAVDAVIEATAGRDRCESGWTGDRCQFRLDHDSPHSNEEGYNLVWTIDAETAKAIWAEALEVEDRFLRAVAQGVGLYTDEEMAAIKSHPAYWND